MIGVPLLVLFLVLLHVVGLHKVGSNNPQGIDILKYRDEQGKPLDGIAFYPHYVWKDCLGAIIFLAVFVAIVFFIPDMNGFFLEPANFTPANPLITPEHITPLWYMAPFYAMLRAVPHKVLGVFVLISALIILLFMPWLDKSPVRAMRYKGYYSKCSLIAWVCCVLILGYLGTVEITAAKLYVARICTVIYFAYFLLMPVYTRRELHRQVPDRIST